MRIRRRLATASRCERWTLTDLVAHTCWGTSFEADGLRRARTGVDGVAQGGDVAADRTADALCGQVAANVRALVDEIDAFLAAPHDRAVPMPYGSVPMTLMLNVFAMESGVHTSDIAAALGEDDRLEGDVCRAAFAFLHAFGPALANKHTVFEPGQSIALRCSQAAVRFVHDGDAWRADDLDATTTISGDDSDVVLFALGRRPIGSMTIEGEPEVAARFKDLIPGP